MKFAIALGLVAAQQIDQDAEVPEYLQKNRPTFNWADPEFYAEQLKLQFNLPSDQCPIDSKLELVNRSYGLKTYVSQPNAAEIQAVKEATSSPVFNDVEILTVITEGEP